MIGERTKALLDAAAVIYAAKSDWANHAGAVEDAYALLELIEQREGKCQMCGQFNGHDFVCPNRPAPAPKCPKCVEADPHTCRAH